jgi:hypothetical protein
MTSILLAVCPDPVHQFEFSKITSAVFDLAMSPMLNAIALQILPPDSRYGVQPLRWVQAMRNLLIQLCYRRTLYWLGIGQFNTMGQAKICGEIYKGVTLCSRDRRSFPPH